MDCPSFFRTVGFLSVYRFTLIYPMNTLNLWTPNGMNNPILPRHPAAMLVTLCLLAVQILPAAAADFEITNLSLSSTNTLLIGFPGDTNSYFILRSGSNVANITWPTAMALGTAGDQGFTVPISGPGSYFRLQRISLNSPLDTDGDGLNDVFELSHSGCLSSLNANDALLDSDGDTLSNSTEYLVGADPCHSNAAPSILVYADSGNYTEPGSFLLATTISGGDGLIGRVDFFADGIAIGHVTNAPYTLDWTNIPAGNYAVTARVVDNHTLTRTSAPISLTVSAPISILLTNITDLGNCVFEVTAIILSGNPDPLEVHLQAAFLPNPEDPDGGLWSDKAIQPTIQGNEWTYSGVVNIFSPALSVRVAGAGPGPSNYYSNILRIPSCP